MSRASILREVLKMPSKVKVNSTICDKTTTIVVSNIDGERVEIKIESDCKGVASFAELLKDASTSDLIDWTNNRIIDLASRSGLTTTCLVPTAVFNCAWVELGMISKTLAKNKSPLCIHFIE